MRFVVLTLVLLSLSLPFCHSVPAQTEDVRNATGLPIPIGAPVIYGEITIRGLAPNEPKPVIYVSLFIGGALADRMQTTERGYYYFLRAPSDGATLVFDVNNSEVGRVVLSAGTGRSVRRDVEIDWTAILATKSPPGVISAKNAYPRSSDANKALDKALAAVKARKNEAVQLLKEIVDKDPEDFVAWTELGTLYFERSKYVDAETAYSRALEQRADFMPALMNLGKLYLSQKEPGLAIAAFFRAASSEPTSAEAFHYLGEAYLQAKQGNKAVIALNEAIRLDPIAMADVHLRLATLYDAAGVKERAAAQYKLFLEKRPNYPERSRLEAYIKANSGK
jgi:Tfp pilus assembly protein PilF